jgi:hypothetical protein
MTGKKMAKKLFLANQVQKMINTLLPETIAAKNNQAFWKE